MVLKGEFEPKKKKLLFRQRPCHRCRKFYLTSTRRGKYCPNCQKPKGGIKKD